MTVFVARITRDVITVSGPDAVTWLQGQLSQDITRLAPGEVTLTFILAPQGKVDGWGRIQRTGDDSLRIDVDPGAGEPWLARLNRFKLRTKADLVLTTDVPTVAVRGAAPEAGLPAGWPGTVGVDYLEAGIEVVAALVADGATEIDAAALDGLRIRAGAPRWGAELGAETIPATIGQWAIDAAVSFTKGCYTGQELVARIDSRGGNVPRRLAAVVLDGPPPPLGAEIVVAGKVSATVTSSALDPVSGGSVALAFIPRSIEVPSAAEIGGQPVSLAALPLPAPA